MEPAVTENAAHRIVSEMVKAFKAVAMYPPGHPARSRFYDRLKKDFAAYLNEFGSLHYAVREGALLVDDEPVATRDGSERFLATECFTRQIHTLSFLRGVTDEDIDLLFTLLATDPGSIREAGGVVEFLRGKGSGALQVEQTDYEGILERREEADPGAASGYAAGAHAPVQTPEAPLDPQSPSPKAFADETGVEISQEEWLTKKLDQLDRAGSAGEYKAVLREILTSLKATGTLNLSQYTVMVLRRMGRHLLAQTPEEIAVMTRATVRELADRGAIEELAGLLVQRDTTDRDPVYAVLDQVYNEAIPVLLKRLADEEDAYGRRTLLSALVRYGEAIRGHLTRWLTDERWYVVRNALGLLLQVGGPADSAGVRTFLRYPNPKVRLEALRFLYRHPVTVDDDLMEALLADKDSEVRARAIYALGVLQGDKGVRRLLALARKPFFGEGDVAGRVMAVKGLGRSGGPVAIELLGRLLRKKGFADAAGAARVRKACVEALVESGEAAAVGILRRALPGLKGPVYKQAEDYVNKHG